MHQLERDAQDDLFLMDAIEGFEKASNNQQDNLVELTGRIAKRVTEEKRRSMLLWRILPIAASMLIMLGVGYWFLNKPAKVEYANTLQPNKQHPEVAKNTPTVKDSVLPQNAMTLNKPQRKQSAKIILPKTGLIAKNTNLRRKADSTSVAANVLGAKKLMVDTNYAYRGEPVVRGYVKRDKDITTGSSFIVTGKEVQDNPVGNVEQLLQGKVAGLNIQNNTGAPGMRGSVNIRGLSSIDSSKLNAIAKDASKKYITVSGEVKDIYGQAMEGATIGAAGKGLAQVDANGKFTVTIPADVNTLVATNIGYKAQVIKIDKQTTLNIKLAPDNRSLSEVVIRGYVKRNRDETTGSSYIVTGKDAGKKIADKNSPPTFAGGKIPGKFLPISPKGQVTNSNCNENLKFKEKFFSNIAIAEKYTIEQNAGKERTVSSKEFLKALRSISKYSPVSFNLIEGYQTGYPTIQAFQKDKNLWLQWYDANKCNNLK